MIKLTIKELKSICTTYSISTNGLKKANIITKLENCMTNNKHIINDINDIQCNRYANNESFGITCEYALCELYNLKNNLINRVHTRSVSNLKVDLSDLKNRHQLEFIKFLGDQNKASDFIGKFQNDSTQKEYTISIKSTIGSDKVCPQNIGQCTKNKFIQNIYLPIIATNNTTTSLNTINPTDYELKSFIITNIDKLIKLYYLNLFSSDILIYIKNINTISYQIIKQKNINLNLNNFTMTRSIDNWNESNTIKYQNKSIGEFQFHSNRNCIKFRFNMTNLLALIA